MDHPRPGRVLRPAGSVGIGTMIQCIQPFGSEGTFYEASECKFTNVTPRRVV